MKKWICLALLFFCVKLSAAELKFPLDSSWSEVELEQGELDFLKSFFVSFHEYEKDGQMLTLDLQTRYSYYESLAQARGRVPGDSIEGMLRALGCECCEGVKIISSDENSIICSGSDEEFCGVVKLILSETHVATISYQYSNSDLQEAIGFVERAELIDDETLPTLHYTLQLDPSIWTNVQDPLKIAQTWLSEDNCKVRAIVAPKNTLYPYETLDDYLLHLQRLWADKMEILEIGENFALIVTSADHVQLEKVTFGDNYVASLSFRRRENPFTTKEIQDWSAFFNSQNLMEQEDV